ncbi:MAG: hypothetical protein ACR2RB_16010 [Gammaproteobacteria bacterium]
MSVRGNPAGYELEPEEAHGADVSVTSRGVSGKWWFPWWLLLSAILGAFLMTVMLEVKPVRAFLGLDTGNGDTPAFWNAIAANKTALGEIEASVDQLHTALADVPAVSDESIELAARIDELRKHLDQATDKISELLHANESALTYRKNLAPRIEALEFESHPPGKYLRVPASGETQ